MKVCSYVMTYNTGLAPNLFCCVCTLALCAPNHRRAYLSDGDWIVGLARKSARAVCAGHGGQASSRLLG